MIQYHANKPNTNKINTLAYILKQKDSKKWNLFYMLFKSGRFLLRYNRCNRVN